MCGTGRAVGSPSHKRALRRPQTLPRSAGEFHQKLTAALAAWKAAGKKGIWLKLQPEHATLLATAYEHGAPPCNTVFTCSHAVFPCSHAHPCLPPTRACRAVSRASRTLTRALACRV